MIGRSQGAVGGTVGRRAVVGALLGTMGLAAGGGCSVRPDVTRLAAHPQPPGTIASLERLGWYPALVGRVVLGLAGVSPEIPVQSGFTPYA